MDKIEKIRAEIERRKQSLRAGICNPDAFTRKQKLEMLVASEELDRLNRFLDTLSEEPDNNMEDVNLEKEIKDTCRGYRINDSHEQELGKQDIENIARHFYELGKNSK